MGSRLCTSRTLRPAMWRTAARGARFPFREPSAGARDATIADRQLGGHARRSQGASGATLAVRWRRKPATGRSVSDAQALGGWVVSLASPCLCASAAYHRPMSSPVDDRNEFGTLRLTELTECGGCAAKLGADALEEALAGLGAGTGHGGNPRPAAGAGEGGHTGAGGGIARGAGAEVNGHPDLLAGLDPPDDAAVHLVAPGVAVIGTVDFFPPIVDDPRTYGAIAAANALSDVYAMGGRVLFALSVAAMPEDLPAGVFRAILEGAAAKVREAGGILAGGHTITDAEPKYGLAVVGVASPDRLLRKGGARHDDVLLLTKPLGTGLLVSGARAGRTSAGDLEAAIASMSALNRAASEILVAHGVRAATDVTGFGLLGHGLEMARASGTTFAFDAEALPAFAGALDLARARIETGGAAHNRRHAAAALRVRPGVAPETIVLAHDPQTSGGLLAAIAADAIDAVEADLRSAGVNAWRIGRVEGRRPGSITLA